MLQLEEVQRRVVEEQDRNKHRQTRRDASFGSNVFFFPVGQEGAFGRINAAFAFLCLGSFEVCSGLFERYVKYMFVIQTRVGRFICSIPSSKSMFTCANELRTSLGLSKKSTKSSFGFSRRKVRQRLQLPLLTLHYHIHCLYWPHCEHILCAWH